MHQNSQSPTKSYSGKATRKGAQINRVENNSGLTGMVFKEQFWMLKYFTHIVIPHSIYLNNV